MSSLPSHSCSFLPSQSKAYKPFWLEVRSWEPSSCFLSFLLSIAPVLSLLGVWGTRPGHLEGWVLGGLRGPAESASLRRPQVQTVPARTCGRGPRPAGWQLRGAPARQGGGGAAASLPRPAPRKAAIASGRTAPLPAAPPHTLRKRSGSGTTRLPSSSRKAVRLRPRTRSPQARSQSPGRLRCQACGWLLDVGGSPDLPPFPVFRSHPKRAEGGGHGPSVAVRDLPVSPGPRPAVGAVGTPPLTRPHPAFCLGGGR